MTEGIDRLRAVPLFANLDEAGLAGLAEVIEELTVPPGTAITTEGRLEGWFYIVVSGTARVVQDGREINVLGPGDFFGEVALLDGGPRTATVISDGEMQLLALKQHRFDDLLAVSPEIHAAVMTAFEEYLRRLDAGAGA